MNDPSPAPDRHRPPGPAFFVLAGALVVFSVLGTLPLLAGVLLALVGAGLGAAARLVDRYSLRALAPVPPLVSLGVLAAFAAATAEAALVGGLVALAYLLWLAEDPDRLPGGPRRALGRLVLPMVGLAIAWASSFLLPPGAAGIGVAAGLLVAVVVLVAFLLRSPQTFDRDAAATS